jgi:hypothetical protein
MRRKLRKLFTLGGLVFGLLYGLLVTVFAYIAAPGWPGWFEVLSQTAVVGLIAAVGAALGFCVGFIVGLFQGRG